MNFVPLSDFDLQSSMPKFKNDVYDESIEQVPGDISSSICERIVSMVTVFNPDQNKVNQLIQNKSDKLFVNSLTFIFSLPYQKQGIDKKCIQRLQDNYPITSYDFDDGATIEYEHNFFVSVKCTSEQIKIKINTEYDFTFSEKACAFSPTDFISCLLD